VKYARLAFTGQIRRPAQPSRKAIAGKGRPTRRPRSVSQARILTRQRLQTKQPRHADRALLVPSVQTVRQHLRVIASMPTGTQLLPRPAHTASSATSKTSSLLATQCSHAPSAPTPTPAPLTGQPQPPRAHRARLDSTAEPALLGKTVAWTFTSKSWLVRRATTAPLGPGGRRSSPARLGRTSPRVEHLSPRLVSLAPPGPTAFRDLQALTSVRLAPTAQQLASETPKRCSPTGPTSSRVQELRLCLPWRSQTEPAQMPRLRQALQRAAPRPTVPLAPSAHNRAQLAAMPP